jgi:hypothetical protein
MQKASLNIDDKLILFFLLGGFYFFGSFGFFNLFGARLLLHFTYFIFLALLFTSVKNLFSEKVLNVYTILFFIFFGFGGFFYLKQYFSIFESILFMTLTIFILNVSDDFIYNFNKVIIYITLVLLFFICIASFSYFIKPELINSSNIFIFDSQTGYNYSSPGNILDYLSFTSGDGYVFGDVIILRMKGYCNEPSATLLHYFSPIVLLLMNKKKNILLILLFLFVNIIFISSLTSIFILILSLFVLLFFFLFKRFSNLFIIPIFILLFFLLINREFVLSKISFLNEILLAQDYDLVNRKLNIDDQVGSFNTRQSGLNTGFYNILKYPFGYSLDPGPGSGLLYLVSMRTGIFGVIFLLIFFLKMYNLCRAVFLSYRFNFFDHFATALIISILFVVIFISSYGWDRPPGLIIMLLFYRRIKLLASNT